MSVKPRRKPNEDSFRSAPGIAGRGAGTRRVRRYMSGCWRVVRYRQPNLQEASPPPCRQSSRRRASLESTTRIGTIRYKPFTSYSTAALPNTTGISTQCQ